MNKKPAIGVCDLGASGGRIFIATLEDKALKVEEVYRFSHNYQPFLQQDLSTGEQTQRFCWNFGLIFGEMLNGLRKIASLENIELKSFGVDTWGSDGVWMTAAGDPLGLVPTGRDPRWQQGRIEILDVIDEKELFKLTGIQSHPFNVLNQVYWYAKYQPDMVKQAAVYAPINSLFHYFLTGKIVAEYTWLSTTQLCKAAKPEYEHTIFQRLDLPLEKMPEIITPGTSIGSCHPELADQVGLKPFEVVVPATHDTACSYAVADTAGKNPMIISTGTWFLAGVKLAEPVLSDDAFNAGFANEGGYDSIRFLKNIMGTWPAQQLRRLWSNTDGKELSWDSFCESAENAKPFSTLLDINNILFFDADNMEQAICDYCTKNDQPVPTSRGQFARAVYEALALKVALTAENVGRITNNPVDEILILGGVSHDDLLLQWMADASGLPVRTGPTDATGFGNAAIQAVALGWFDSIETAAESLKANYKQKVFEPATNTQWQQAKQKLKERCNS